MRATGERLKFAAIVKPRRRRWLPAEARDQFVESGKHFRYIHGANRPYIERQWPLEGQEVSRGRLSERRHFLPL